VTYKVRVTEEAHGDLERLYDFLLEGDLGAAERALVAIELALNLLAFSPFSRRKALVQKNPRWRKLFAPIQHPHVHPFIFATGFPDLKKH
jgi:plasmid stabilization system protein ParE